MLAALLLSLIVSAEPTALDRTDPAGVAQAYLTASAAGDAAAAKALALRDAGVDALVAILAAQGPGSDWFFHVYGLLPGAFAGTPELGAAAVAGDGPVTVELTRVFRLPQKLVLVKNEAGDYAVDLRASMFANLTDPPQREMLAEQLRQFDKLAKAGLPATGPDFWMVYQRLYELNTALVAFAKERGKLPNAAIWMDELGPYLDREDPFSDGVHQEEEFSFAFNLALSEQPLTADYVAARDLVLLASLPGNAPNAVFQIDDLVGAEARYHGFTLLGLGSNEVYLLPAEMSFAAVRHEEHLGQNCLRRLSRLIAAAKDYAAKNGGRLPSAEAWTEEIEAYLKKEPFDDGVDLLVCPLAAGGPCTYAINQEIAGRTLQELINHREIPLFFEVEPGPRNRAVPADHAGAPRHWSQGSFPTGKQPFVGYLDGTVLQMQF